ncbi:MAG: hypothetical protein HXY40_07800 [Chloroflexi bacterium]|nr:hypothetical protein [Chloroflexota bacterium]
MLWIRRFFAVILAFVVVLLLPLALWVGAGLGAFLNAETYKNGLAQQNLYADLLPAALPVIARQTDSNNREGFSQLLSGIPPEAREEAIALLLPPTWLQTQVERGLDLFFGWLNGDATALNTPLDFSELQDRLRGDAAQQAIDSVLNAAPLCTQEQIAQIRSLGQQDNSVPPICQPPAEYDADLRAALAQTLTEVADNLQENPPTVARLVNIPDDRDTRVIPIVIDAFGQLFSVLYLCPAALVALIVMLVVRSLQSFGRWVGPISMIAAFLAILPLPLVPSSLIASATADITSRMQQSPEQQLFQVRLATGLISSGFEQFGGPVVAQALLLLVLATLLLGLPPLLARRAVVSTTIADGPTLTTPRTSSTASARRTGEIQPPSP